MFFPHFHLHQGAQGLLRRIVLPQPPQGQTAVQTGQRGGFLAFLGGLRPCIARGISLALRLQGLAQPEPKLLIVRLVGLAGAEVVRILERLAEGRLCHCGQVVLHCPPALLEVRQHIHFTDMRHRLPRA